MLDIILQIVYTVLVLGFLIFVHELGHFICAKLAKVKVNEFALGMGPAILKKQRGETLYALRLFPIGGYVSMEGEDENSEDANSFGSKPVWKRLIIVLAGAFMNFLVGFIITLILVLSAEALPSLTIAQFDENALSDDCGLKVGDTIIAVGDKKVNVYTDIATDFSLEFNTDKIDITVLRNGETVVLEDVRFPTVEAAEGLNSMVVDFVVYRQDKTVGNILKQTCYRTASFISMMYESLADLVTGKMSIKYVSGPVGTSGIISEAVNTGWESLLWLVALISLNLAVFNLLPLPALDGGRAVFLLIELIFRKRVPQKYEAVVHFVGIIVLFAFMIFITFKDILFPL